MEEDKNIDIEQLKKDLEDAKAKCEEYLNGWKRERADFMNYKKDEMERISNLAKYANEEIILNLLPVLDNICLAEEHLKDEGISQIKKQFLDLLKKEGIEPIETIGKQFDVNIMEAVGETASAEGSGESRGETVAEEVQQGYTLHGKLIRPARVKVVK